MSLTEISGIYDSQPEQFAETKNERSVCARRQVRKEKRRRRSACNASLTFK